MNDRIPGSSWSNPICYRGYRIVVGNTCFAQYEFAHDDYDGAFDAKDNRCGHADTVEACKAQIDDLEDC